MAKQTKIKVVKSSEYTVTTSTKEKVTREIEVEISSNTNVLSPEKQEKADRILALNITKKAKILLFADMGFTRSEVLSFGFVNPTYIYDIYGLKYKELCE